MASYLEQQKGNVVKRLAVETVDLFSDNLSPSWGRLMAVFTVCGLCPSVRPSACLAQLLCPSASQSTDGFVRPPSQPFQLTEFTPTDHPWAYITGGGRVSPEFGARGTPHFLILQNFKHQITCITMQ